MIKKRGLFEDKRGQGLSVNAIILIILGLVVLAALIIGFTFGFQGLKDRFSTSNNVGTIVSACQTACATNDAFSYCTTKREIKMNAEDLTSVNSAKKNETADLELATKYSCNELLNYTNLKVQDCSNLC